MSSRTLEFDRLQLRSTQDKWELSVVTSATFRTPRALSSLDDANTVKALTSGNIWVSRGNGCRIDFQISIEGKLVDKGKYLHLLETIGHRVRDAKLWSQLLLLAFLGCPQVNQVGDSQSHLSVRLSCGTPISKAEILPRGWLMDNVDVNPPKGVSQAEFERMYIQFNFLTTQGKLPSASEGQKSWLDSLGAPKMMLQDHSSKVEREQRLGGLEDAVGVLSRGLSASISRGFEPKPSHTHGHFANSKKYTFSQSSTTKQPKPKRNKGNTRSKYPQQVIEILKSWLDAHADNPCPTKDERQVLMKETELQSNQISNWLRNAKRKLKVTKPAKHHETLLSRPYTDAPAQGELEQLDDDEMLLFEGFEGEEDMLFPQGVEQPEDGMLVSQSDTDCLTQPSLTSQSCTISTISISSSTQPLKHRLSLDDTILDQSSSPKLLETSPACKLAESALQILISGSKRGFGDIEMKRPLPETSLANLVPAMFCPGFKEIMAHNARFLPTISNAICGTWVQNGQGAALKKKLRMLAKSEAPIWANEDLEEEAIGVKRTHQRLAAVVQSSLWGMMQRKLFDHAAVRKLSCRATDVGSDSKAPQDDGGDLLEAAEKLDGDDVEGDFETFIGHDSASAGEGSFEDLLEEEDDGELLGWFNEDKMERERLAVEQETDEMVFGNGWDGDDGKEVHGEVEEVLPLNCRSEETDEEEDVMLLDSLSLCSGEDEVMLV